MHTENAYPVGDMPDKKEIESSRRNKRNRCREYQRDSVNCQHMRIEVSELEYVEFASMPRFTVVREIPFIVGNKR